METSLSGRGATTVYRDKSGKKIDLDEEKRKKDEIEKKKAEDGVKYDRWKKGYENSSYGTKIDCAKVNLILQFQGGCIEEHWLYPSMQRGNKLCLKNTLILSLNCRALSHDRFVTAILVDKIPFLARNSKSFTLYVSTN